MQISKEYLFDFAFLNPSTMKLCNLALGDTILIENLNENLIKDTNYQIFCTCWPQNLLDPTQIALNKSYLTINGFCVDQNILLHRISRNDLVHADQISLELVKNLSSTVLFNASNNENDFDLILDFLKEIYLNKSISSNQLLQVVYMGQKLVFKIVKVASNNNLEDLNSKLNNLKLTASGHSRQMGPISAFYISSSTKFFINDEAKKSENEPNEKEKILFKDLGGLDKEIELIKEIFVDPFKFSTLYNEVGIEFSKGVILYGPSGCGKTMLASAILNESNCNYVQLNVSEIYSR